MDLAGSTGFVQPISTTLLNQPKVVNSKTIHFFWLTNKAAQARVEEG
ncbi:hypothetical protein A2U01_0082533, partial [Trifolium medium]|nr:hypothetical protein [Trifolium medium]